MAVVSGKGGTGKTTIAAHLALASSRSRKTLLVDLDVEAPDDFGYFPEAFHVGKASPVSLAVPRLSEHAATAVASAQNPAASTKRSSGDHIPGCPLN